jgi:hypothetical protein
VKSLQVKATKGDKCAMSKGDKLRQIRCRLLSHFDSVASAAHFVGRMAKGMVSKQTERLSIPESRQNHVRLNVCA